MTAGMIPITVGLHGENSFRAPMGAAVIGGLLASTALSLFVVPVIYTLMDGFEHRVKRLIRRISGRAAHDPVAEAAH
jgi:Cu/Ag efflux pump CusA